mgnify:FL=1
MMEINNIFDPLQDFKKNDVEQIAAQQLHLSVEQCHELVSLLKKFPHLFGGDLGLYPHQRIHIELEPNAHPVHRHPYAVPQSSMQQFKETLNSLCQLNVLEHCGASEWGLPCFVIPKKDGSV